MRSKWGGASRDGEVCGSRSSGDGDESGRKGGALIRSRVVAISMVW